MNTMNLLKKRKPTASANAKKNGSAPPAGPKWSIRVRILAVILGSIVAVESVALIGLLVVGIMSEAFFRASQEMPAKLEALSKAQSQSLLLVSEIRQYLLVSGEEDESIAEATQAKAELNAALKTYTNVVENGRYTTEPERELANRLETLAADLQQKADAVAQLNRSGVADNEMRSVLDDLDTAADGLSAVMIEAQMLSSGERLAGIGRIDQVVKTVRWVMMVYPLILSVVLLVYSSLVGRSISSRLKSLTQTADQIVAGDFSRKNTVSGRDELGLLGHTLNLMVEKMTGNIVRLERESKQRDTLLQINQKLTGILSLDELLVEVVRLTKETFDYYYTHIYLLDEQKQVLNLAQGYGRIGEEMKAAGHHIDLNAPTSLVARAARTGQMVWVDDVREAPDWLPNPLLSETHSEIAVPILAEGKVVGVLDVQDNVVAGFDRSDANLLLALANQVAVAIKNVALFANVQTALAETREVQKQYIQQGWDRNRIVHRGVGLAHFSQLAQDPLPDTAIEQARELAFQYNQPTMVNAAQLPDNAQPETQEDYAGSGLVSDGRQVLVAPIVYREVPIGNLQFHHVTPDRVWTEGELALINTVLDQLAQVAEQQRLFDETQERASRERLIAEIGDKMRRAPNLQTLMQVITAELSKALNPMRVFTQLGLTPADQPASQTPPEPSPFASSTEPDNKPLPSDPAPAGDSLPHVNGRQAGNGHKPFTSGELL